LWDSYARHCDSGTGDLHHGYITMPRQEDQCRRITKADGKAAKRIVKQPPKTSEKK